MRTNNFTNQETNGQEKYSDGYLKMQDNSGITKMMSYTNNNQTKSKTWLSTPTYKNNIISVPTTCCMQLMCCLETILNTHLPSPITKKPVARLSQGCMQPTLKNRSQGSSSTKSLTTKLVTTPITKCTKTTTSSQYWGGLRDPLRPGHHQRSPVIPYGRQQPPRPMANLKVLSTIHKVLISELFIYSNKHQMSSTPSEANESLILVRFALF